MMKTSLDLSTRVARRTYVLSMTGHTRHTVSLVKFLTIPGPRRDGTNVPPRQDPKASTNVARWPHSFCIGTSAFLRRSPAQKESIVAMCISAMDDSADRNPSYAYMVCRSLKSTCCTNRLTPSSLLIFTRLVRLIRSLLHSSLAKEG